MGKIEKYKLNGKTVLRIEDINPWEFRGCFEGRETGLTFTFQYKEVERIKEE